MQMVMIYQDKFQEMHLLNNINNFSQIKYKTEKNLCFFTVARKVQEEIKENILL